MAVHRLFAEVEMFEDDYCKLIQIREKFQTIK